MPAFQKVVSKLNAMSLPDRLEEIPAELFEPGRKLSDAARELDSDVADVADYLDALPEGIHEALRAVIHSALTREQRQPITFAWMPSYDYELRLWDVSNTAKTAGGITVLLGSRYPDDTHPLAQS